MTQHRSLAVYLCDLAYAIFLDDSVVGIETRTPKPPIEVNGLESLVYEAAPERVRGFVVRGSFNTAALMALDHTGGRFDDRYDEIELYLTPASRPEHLGARVTIAGQPDALVSALEIRPETVRDPASADGVRATPKGGATPIPTAATPTTPVTARPGTADSHAPGLPALGSTEPVPPVELAPFVDERTAHQLAVFASFEGIEQIAVYGPAAPDRLFYGLAPSFVPVISLGTNGMVIGLMIDAPELGFADDAACLFQYEGAGVGLSDARVSVLSVIWRSLTERRRSLEARGDSAGLARWHDLAADFADLMGYAEFSESGVGAYAWSARRRKPSRAPRGTKWRTDASGNGVLAPVAAWGDQSIRRPRTASAALDRAAEATAPALGLHFLREALAIANRTGDAQLAAEAYAAMAAALADLGRPAIAARARALADCWPS